MVYAYSNSRLIEKANAVADAINAVEPGRALAVVGDITDTSYISELVKRTADFGNGKIHIIVNNAGFTWDGVIHKVGRNLSSFPRAWEMPVANTAIRAASWLAFVVYIPLSLLPC